MKSFFLFLSGKIWEKIPGHTKPIIREILLSHKNTVLVLFLWNKLTVIITSIDIESKSSDCYSNHALRVIKELDGFSVQREIILVLKETEIKKKLAECLHTLEYINSMVTMVTRSRYLWATGTCRLCINNVVTE